MYIEVLEKIFDAFDRIPQCIKEKFPGYDSKTYEKIKRYKTKLKAIIDVKPNKSDNKNNEINSQQSSPSLLDRYVDDDDDLQNFDLKHNYITKRIDKNNTNNILTPEMISFNRNPGPSKTIYSDFSAKKSLPFNGSPATDTSKTINLSSDFDLDVSDNSSKPKGKFVFKRPSLQNNEKSIVDTDVQSKTLDRFKNASEKLKPLPPPVAPKKVVLNESSVEFQPPPNFTKASLLINGDSPKVDSPMSRSSMLEDFDEMEDYQVPLDFDDDTDLNVEESKTSVINISDSFSQERTQNVNGKEVPIDEDGWPEYRIEDFEDDILLEDEPKTAVVNLMDQSMNRGKEGNKYEGMGDFHAGTENDGITGIVKY